MVELSVELLQFFEEGSQAAAVARFRGRFREGAELPPTPFDQIWSLTRAAPDAGWRLAYIEELT